MCVDKGPGHPVTLVDVGQGVAAAEAVAVHHGLHQAADVQKADLILQEQFDRFLVGAVGGAGAQAPLGDGLFAGGQAAEGLLVGPRRRSAP